MEWKSSADKEKYGDVVGEVIHHTLFEDGTITKYDVKFGNRIIKNIPTAMLEVVNEKHHSHEADEDDEEKEETFANYGPKGDRGPNKAVKAKKVKQTIKKIT